MKKDQKIVLSLINLQGTIVLKREFYGRAGVNEVTLDNTGTLPNGTYLLHVKFGDQTQTKVVLKEE